MKVTYKILPDGGFVAGDLDSKITAYAYPEGLYAVTARRRPLDVAEEMLWGELRTDQELADGTDYDRRNWMRLEGIEVPEEVLA